MMDIVVENLTVQYGKKVVLRNLSVTFKEGETTVVMGPSGCGKTTLINALLGLVHTTGGRITGVPSRAACVFQEDRLCEDISASENVRIVLRHRSEYSLVEPALTAVGLGDSLGKIARELSGGMRRRVAIIRAVLAESGVVVMDEPLKGLDEATRDRVVDYIREKTKGKTLIVITHDEREANLFGADVLRLAQVLQSDTDTV